MIDKTQRDLILEIWQSMYGVPNTEEGGLLKRVATMDSRLCQMNGCVKKNTQVIFGVNNDDNCIMKRLARIEKVINWVYERGWRLALLLVLILLGLMGFGGIMSQVLEGIWKRGTPL